MTQLGIEMIKTLDAAKRRKRFFGMVEAVWRKNAKAKPEVGECAVAAAVRAVRKESGRQCP